MDLDNGSVLGHINNSPRARVVRHLQEWMKDGRLVAGSRLPPEMHLADKFNVSRNTIRLALADLNTQGLIRSGNRKWLVKDNVSPVRSPFSNSVVIIVEPSADSPLDYSHVPHTSSHLGFILLGAISGLRKAGYDAFVAHPESLRGELVQRIIGQRPKGAIILSQLLQDESGKVLSKALHEGNIPSVIYGDLGLATQDSHLTAGIDSVVSDHEAGAYALTKWLISQGRKKILRFWQTHMAGPEERQYWLAQRDLGYERAMTEAGLEPLPPLEIYDPNYRAYGLTQQRFDHCTRLMAGYLLERLQGPEKIDAIMAACDDTIGQLAAALKLHGIVPNKDIFLVGYDNMWDNLEEIQQGDSLGPVATIDKKNLEIGAHLMSLLQERMDGKLFAQGEHRVVLPNLVIRPAAFAEGVVTIPLELFSK